MSPVLFLASFTLLIMYLVTNAVGGYVVLCLAGSSISQVTRGKRVLLFQSFFAENEKTVHFIWFFG